MKLKMMTNKDLKKMYLSLNTRFFDDRLIKDMVVEFIDDLIDEEDEADLNGLFEGDSIWIDSNFKKLGRDYVQIVLLHEMAHADLPGYYGNDPDEGHGMLFQAKIYELIQRGAYDSIL